MKVRTLFIGDPHFKINNFREIDIFINQIRLCIIDNKPDLIVVSGDILHTHERLHTLVLNKAYEFIKLLSRNCMTYILVGNHDYISNTQFLTTNHWMNAMKDWNNVVIVDKVTQLTIETSHFIFVPYVFPGRFQEALDTISIDMGKVTCIFAHQEFKGCKLGALLSEIGDVWDPKKCLIISGHIHTKHWCQTNIYYPGSPLQHSYGDSSDCIVSIVTFENKKYNIEEIALDVPKKKIIYLNTDEFKSYRIKLTKDEDLKIVVKGDINILKLLKKTKQYRDIIKHPNIKIILKNEVHNSLTQNNMNKESTQCDNNTRFINTLKNIVLQQKDFYTLKAYEEIINNNILSENDVFFL